VTEPRSKRPWTAPLLVMAFVALIVVPLYAWQTVPDLLAGTDPSAEPKSPAPREAVDDAHTFQGTPYPR
jgi:hypothetical protein